MLSVLEILVVLGHPGRPLLTSRLIRLLLNLILVRSDLKLICLVDVESEIALELDHLILSSLTLRKVLLRLLLQRLVRLHQVII